jgi:hypothetical protein
MADASPGPAHALVLLNIPLADAFPHYWLKKELHRRAAAHLEDPKPPTLLQINAAAAVLPHKDGFAITRGLANGRWEGRWSPDTHGYNAELVFSTDPPALRRSVFSLPTRAIAAAGRGPYPLVSCRRSQTPPRPRPTPSLDLLPVPSVRLRVTSNLAVEHRQLYIFQTPPPLEPSVPLFPHDRL